MILLAALLLVLVAAVQAAAASDRVERVRFVGASNDWAWTDGPCDFAVSGHSGGTLQITSFYDREGNLVRDVVTFADWKVTFSANGKVLETPSPSVIHDTYQPDGSYTQAITGLGGHYVVPGEGLAWNWTGRLVLYFEDLSDQSPDVVVFTGGHPDGTSDQFAAMCRLLAP